LVDFDAVEPSNLASQGYLEEDLGRPKVEATGAMCLRINRSLEPRAVNDRFRRSMEIGTAVFCAVDKIEIRRAIWEAVKDKASFFVDGRMSAEVLRVLTACDTPSRKHYPTTLFAAGEAYAGPCTAKTTIYCANIAAGFMVAQFTRWLRRLPPETDIVVNLLSCDLSVQPSVCADSRQ
jgi:sulfur carrier protein ThiS adenylyltransferase